MKDLVPIFNLGVFGELRVHYDQTLEPWFCCADIARGLEYSQKSDINSLFNHVPKEWKSPNPIGTLGGPQNMLTVNEQGLWFFLGRSDKPKALPFQKKVAGEVLPSIRKTGSFNLPNRPGRRAPERLTNTEKAVSGSLLGFLYPNLGNRVLANFPDFLSLNPQEQVRILMEAYPPALPGGEPTTC